MHDPDIQKAGIQEKSAFADKGYLCSKSYGPGLMLCFQPPLFQKLIAD